MNSTKNTKKLIRNINVTPGARMDQRTLDDILLAQEKTKKTALVVLQPGVGRIIMTSNVSKLAVVAAFVIAVLIGMNQFGLLDTTSTAFAHVKAAVSEAGWMHLSGISIELNGEKKQHDVWLSVKRQIIASESPDGSNVVWLDYTNEQRHVYDADANELRLMGLSQRKSPNDSAVWEYMDLWLGNEFLVDAQIEERVEVVGDMNVRVYEVILSEEQGNCHLTIVADAQEKRPISISLKAETTEGGSYSAEYRCEYTDNGPTNVYALGVPPSVRVIDMLPSVGIKELAEIFSEKRERFSPYVFVCVNPSQGVVYANRIRGDTWKAAKHVRYISGGYAFINNSNLCAEVETDVLGFVEDLPKRKDAEFVSAELWDGKHAYQIDNSDWSIKKSREGGDIRSVGHFWSISGMVGRVIENDFSKSRHLVAVKTGRMLSYFDPRHDYACVRYEYARKNGKALLRELTGFVLTREGYWYPRNETGTVITFDNNGNEISREITFTHRYFIEKLVDLPKDYFDVDKNISKIMEGRNR